MWVKWEYVENKSKYQNGLEVLLLYILIPSISYFRKRIDTEANTDII